MRKITLLALAIGLMFSSNFAFGQRYIQDVFTDVTVTSNIQYATNISVLTGSPASEDLYLDVYEPMGDTETSRPLMIYLHTGNFLPNIINGSPAGDKSDSTVVAMCTKFAQKGYVVAAINYRLGWDPLNTSQDVRTSTLINAAYRGLQDAKTAVRFFRDNFNNGGNTYGIDESKIIIGGNGTGGYLSSSYSALDRYQELTYTKFIDFSQSPPAPYIDSSLAGNLEGTNNRPLCIANYPNESSEAHVSFLIGGAIPDTTWIESGEPAIIGIQCPSDVFAPYMTGSVIVPTTGEFVIEGSGSYDIVRKSLELGNNSMFVSAGYSDPVTMRANMVNDSQEGLFPFVMPAPGSDLPCGTQIPQGSPWDFWDEATYIATCDAYIAAGAIQNVPGGGATYNCLQLRSNPDMSATKARTYIDSAQAYICPRLVTALGLSVSIDEITLAENSLKLFPNPTNGALNVYSEEYTIEAIKMYNATGQLMLAEQVNRNLYNVSDLDLARGIYFINVEFEFGTVTRKVIIE